MKKKLLSIITFCLFTLVVYGKNNSTLRIPFTLNKDNFIIIQLYSGNEIFNFRFDLVVTDCELHKTAVPKLKKTYFNDDRDLKEIFVETYMEQYSVDYAEAEKFISDEILSTGINICPDFSFNGMGFLNRSFFLQLNYYSDENIDGCIGPSFFSNVDNIFIDYKESYIEINSKIKGKNSVPLYNMADENKLSNYTPVYILSELNGIKQPFIITSFPLSSSRQDIHSSYVYKGEEFWNIVNDSTEINLEYNTDFEAEITVGNVSDKINIIKYSDDKILSYERGRKMYQLYNSLGNDFFKDKRILVDYKHKKFYIW